MRSFPPYLHDKFFIQSLTPTLRITVDLTLITSTQTLDLVYEGQTRRFCLSSVSAAPDADEDHALAESIGSLSLADGPSKIWSVGWETTVILDTIDKGSSSEKNQGTSQVRRTTRLSNHNMTKTHLVNRAFTAYAM